MYIILCYDVNVKRVAKARKICLKYLQFSQKSVYEGIVTIAQLNKLKRELKTLMNPKEDQITIYKMESTRFAIKEKLGKSTNFELIL